MEDKNINLKLNLFESYTQHHNLFKETRLEMNDFFYGTIKLLITLSTTILIVSVAFTDKIISLTDIPVLYLYLLKLSWVFLFFSIVCFVYTMLQAADANSKSIKKISIRMKSLLRQIEAGQLETSENINPNESFIEYFPLLPAIIGIALFIIGITNICICLTSEIIKLSFWRVVFVDIIFLAPLGWLVYSHYKHR
jgi:hypothetical protein